MRSHLRILGTSLLLLAAINSTSCSRNKTKSQKVLITVSPPSPTVITTDFKYTSINGISVPVKGPWFEMTSITIENQSDTSVMVVGLHIEVTGTDTSGNFVTVPTDFTPTSLNFQDISVPYICDYPTYGTFTAAGNTGSKGLIQVTKSPSSTGTCPTFSRFYIGGGPTPISTTSIRYTVKVKPIGYFVDGNGVPTDRFENSTTIYTK